MSPTGDGHSPRGALASILNTVVAVAVAKLERKVADWTDKLNDVATGDASSGGLTQLADEGLDELGQGGGAAQKAGAEVAKAELHGKNPIWAAVKGAWQAGTPVTKATIVAGAVSAVVLLLLSPVLLLLLLLSLLIISVVYRARASTA
jgi:hypothetical protein